MSAGSQSQLQPTQPWLHLRLGSRTGSDPVTVCLMLIGKNHTAVSPELPAFFRCFAACDELHKADSVFRKHFPCICFGTSANACIRFTLRAAAGWFRRPAAFRGFAFIKLLRLEPVQHIAAAVNARISAPLNSSQINPASACDEDSRR